jgi:predicted CXXCH cytochrome family protein
MSHPFRFLLLVIAVAAFILIVRAIIVPSDFKVHNGDYKYQYYRTGNVEEWKNFEIKFQGREYCGDCHPEEYEKIVNSKHAMNQCENCHGPAYKHPDKVEKLTIDRSRDLCLRCHAELPYRPNVYAELSSGPIELIMQNPEEHNPGEECVLCHDPHATDFK